MKPIKLMWKRTLHLCFSLILVSSVTNLSAQTCVISAGPPNAEVNATGSNCTVMYTIAAATAANPAGGTCNTYITEIEIHKEGRIIRVGTHGRGIFEGSLEFDLVSTTETASLSDCITAYPNPVRSILNTNAHQNESIQLVNTYGQLVMKIITPSTDISHLAKGNYYLLKNDKESKNPCVTSISKL